MMKNNSELPVSVKALEWARENPYHTARTDFGHYSIERVDSSVTYFELKGSFIWPAQKFLTFDEAKAAAQADYEARIRSALVAAPKREDKPAAEEYKHPEWIWYCESTSGQPVVTFGRWGKHPQQRLYKIAAIQPTEHDHPPIPPAEMSMDDFKSGMDELAKDAIVSGFAAEAHERGIEEAIRAYYNSPNYKPDSVDREGMEASISAYCAALSAKEGE